MISERSLAKTCRSAVLGRARIIVDRATAITERTCSYDGSVTNLAARVGSSAGVGAYHVAISIDESADAVTRHNCTCPAAARFPGPCKHAVAVALDFNRHADAYAGWDELEHVTTTSVVANYLDRASTAAAIARTTGTGEKAGTISLMPTLIHDGELFCQLRIAGGHGSYVVKSIGDLVARVADGTWHSYGKRLAFAHTTAAFEPWSRELVSFLARCIQNRRAYGADRLYGRVYASSHMSGSVGRELRLSGPETDELIGLCVGRTISYGRATATRAATKVTVVDGDPSVALAITPVADGSFRLERGDAIDFFVTPTHAYAVQSDRLYRCSDSFAAAGAFFSGVYCSPATNLLLSADDAPRFAAVALPTLETALPVVVPPELEALRPSACQLEFRLDRSGGAITCEVQATYGERRHDVLARDGGGDYGRDLRAESAARALVGRYFTGTASGRATLRTTNGDAVAALLFDGVPAMRAMGTVLATKAFAALTARARPRVSIGLAVRANLIDLTVSADDIPAAELSALLSRYRRHKRYYRLRSGAFVDLSTLDLDHASLIVDELGLTPAELSAGHATVPSYKAFLLDALLEGDERDEAFVRYVEGFRSVDPVRYVPPANIAACLRPYQVDGFRWLAALADMGFGGILADEMGLGKSVQLIALLLALREGTVGAGSARPEGAADREGAAGQAETVEDDARARRGADTSLIVCPASLVYNWQAEFVKFAPELDVAVAAGSASERRRIRREGHEVLVTSYDLARRDVEDYAALHFRCLVLDEAHYIKNHETLSAQAVKTIDAQHRFALTGTPVENRLAELWSIFDFLMPGLLGGYDRFRERYEQPVIDGDDGAATRLGEAVGPFILRRRKADVLSELPDKLEQVVVAHMGPAQRRLYAAHEQALRQSLASQGEAAFTSGRMQVLAELMRLRQLCCDPRLVYDDYDGGSCKLDTIVELVSQAIASQQKALVFSQFTSYLALIANELRARDVPFYTITGATPKRRRVELVDDFNADDTPVFLVSLKAGGTGLNLTGASVVIHADPWWNAAAQDQATDRAHRIGQTRDVTVYKVIAERSIEERIVRLQDAKADLAERAVSGTGGTGGLASLTRDDMIELLGDD